MKKFFYVFIILLNIFCCISCEKNKNKINSKQNIEFSWHVLGDNQISVNNNIQTNSTNPSYLNKMDLLPIEENTDNIFNNNILQLFSFKNIYFGASATNSYTKVFIDNTAFLFDNSYTFNICSVKHDLNDSSWLIEQYLNDFKSINLDIITPSLLTLTKNNFVCIGTPGVYTLMLAKYKDNKQYDYGIALIKERDIFSSVIPKEETINSIKVNYNNETISLSKDRNSSYYCKSVSLLKNSELYFTKNDNEELVFDCIDIIDNMINIDNHVIKVQEPGDYFIKVEITDSIILKITKSSYGLIGSFNNWEQDIALLKDSSGNYSVELYLNNGDEIRIRLDNRWDISYGIDEKGSNYIVKESSNYLITFNITTKLLEVKKGH